MKRSHAPVGVAILVIILLGSDDYLMVGEHYVAQFDGIVVAREDFVHYPSWTRNLATKYVIREADGSNDVYYADPSQGHIDGFPIGTHLSKRRWRMDYAANGESRNDFPLPIYFMWMVLNGGLIVAAVIIGIMISVRDRRTRELEMAVERGERLLSESDRER